MRGWIFGLVFTVGCSVAVETQNKQSASALRGIARQNACEVFENAVCVCDDLSSAGTLAVAGNVGVDGHLAMAGTLDVSGSLDAESVTVAGTMRVGSRKQRTFLPCGCDDAQLLDVQATIASQRGIAKPIDRLDALSEGSYFHDGDISVAGLSHLVVDGHVSLYIDGSIASAGERRIEIHPGATLDMYVSGSVASAGEVVLGDPDRPSAFRLFVGGTTAIAGEQRIDGLLYAPKAHVAFAGDAVVHGAIFARSLSYAGDLEVDFDPPTCVSRDGAQPKPGCE
jgi:cytoskeletal protein CcmA (bactofilin family)